MQPLSGVALSEVHGADLVCGVASNRGSEGENEKGWRRERKSGGGGVRKRECLAFVRGASTRQGKGPRPLLSCCALAAR
eukprot:1846453-Rhodomonas_salina.3